MKILICTTEFPPFGSGIANVVYMIRKRLETVEDISTHILTKKGGDINLASRIGNLPGFLGRLYFWKKAIDFIVKNKDNYDIIWLHSPLLIDTKKMKYIKRLIITVHTTYYGIYNARKIHGITKGSSYYSIARKIERKFLKNLSETLQHNITSRIIAISPIISMELRENGLSLDVSVIPNGVDTNRFILVSNKRDLRKQYNIPEEAIIFISVGRLIYQKQPFKMIKFFSVLLKYLKNIFLLVVGSGKLIDDMREMTRRLNLSNIRILGYVDDNDLPLLYACSDIYLMTSSYEGHPITLLEAMASGLPPIVSNIPVLKDIVEKSNSGLVLNFNNIEESVNKTLKFIKEEKPKKHSKRARFFIENKYRWKKMTDQYIQILRACTEQ